MNPILILNKETVLEICRFELAAKLLDKLNAFRWLSNEVSSTRIGSSRASIVDPATRVASVSNKSVRAVVSHHVNAALQAMKSLYPRESVSEGDQLLIQRAIYAATTVSDVGKICNSDFCLSRCV